MRGESRDDEGGDSAGPGTPFDVSSYMDLPRLPCACILGQLDLVRKKDFDMPLSSADMGRVLEPNFYCGAIPLGAVPLGCSWLVPAAGLTSLRDSSARFCRIFWVMSSASRSRD